MIFRSFPRWNIIEIAKLNGWHHRKCIVFDKYLYPGYTNRKALDQKSFPCNDALIYTFYQRGEEDDEEDKHQVADTSHRMIVLDAPRKDGILQSLKNKFATISCDDHRGTQKQKCNYSNDRDGDDSCKKRRKKAARR